MYGTIEWVSWRYPNKRYVVHCFSPELYIDVLALVMFISDYHTVVGQLHQKH